MSNYYLVFIFFAFMAIINFFGFRVYYIMLRQYNRMNISVRDVVVFLVYIAFSAYLIAPIIISLSYFESWRKLINSSTSFLVYYLILYIISVLPGAINFKIKYLAELKRMGLFKNKGRY